MRNAKVEFTDHLVNYNKTFKDVKCCTIKYWPADTLSEEEDAAKVLNLKLNYELMDMVNFLQDLDFAYDSGWGCQELYGTIWYLDGTWSTRGEYDGSEWWEYQEVPDIPLELQR